MAIQIVALAAEAVAVDVMAGTWTFGQPGSYTLQNAIGWAEKARVWALEATLVPALVDHIFGSYVDEKAQGLMVPDFAKGGYRLITCLRDIQALFPEPGEAELFTVGMVRREKGYTRKQVKRALKAVRRNQLAAV